MCHYWGNGYDWRAREALLNRFDQFVTTIDGIDVLSTSGDSYTARGLWNFLAEAKEAERELLRGQDRFSADSMDFDNVAQVLQMDGRVHGTLVPAPQH